ncbi:MAG: hypothetical protein JWR61_1465 [Ferruginibacter sp.]|uniref:DUF1569 domain-containing protein n=1 Tax=Ferruginibacter sp. TaxID=1940288 RepID=UPI0026591C58|nr:DUF1569 domain-containing protein [Ferruginibacter sp.]MDB5276510.1 hypothetical protein [Ferruginibacter sp.]
MKSIFDPSIRAEIINRINALDDNSTAQWGKMTLYQMLKHCTLWEEMILGKKSYKQVFMGRLFGRIALKKVLKDEQPLGRNSPTITALKITDDGDIAAQKKKWIALIEEEAHFSNPDFVHPFFGKMTKEQIGYMAYKHADHHLRQFNG